MTQAESSARAFEGTGAKATKALIGINVAVYIAELAQGGGVYGLNSTIYEKGFLYAPFVGQGDWWRLVTAAFLHYGPFHLLLNMLALYWFGSLLEQRIGSGRYLLIYLVSGLAGSAGALVLSPTTATVGASGAIFGILGAGLVLERQRDYVFGGSRAGGHRGESRLHVRVEREHLGRRPYRRAHRRSRCDARDVALRPRERRIRAHRAARDRRDRRRRSDLDRRRLLEGEGLRLAGGAMATVLVDAENVRRSLWPNMPGDELVERSKAWGEQEGHEVQVVWEGSESGDDQIARLVRELDPPVWVVTSDRELRERVHDHAERIIGGGSFAKELAAD